MPLRTLTTEEVLLVHDTLVADFAATEDPISPSGVRSMALLESAVGRQHTGIGGTLKYPEPIENAATLLYGLCNDHPFHNGNKRTALVSMLVHLDKNKCTVFGASQGELYDFMLRVASHALVKIPRRNRRRRGGANADEEVAAITKWLTDRVSGIRRGERQITYRELERILKGFGFHLENPRKNMIDIVRYVPRKRGLFRPATVLEPERVGHFGWPGDNRDISVNDIKKVRAMCKLREEDGVDSDCFYTQDTMIDTFVNRYRTVLRRLARV